MLSKLEDSPFCDFFSWKVLLTGAELALLEGTVFTQVGRERTGTRSWNSTLNNVSRGTAFQVWHSVGNWKALYSKGCPEQTNTKLLFQMEIFIFSTEHLNFTQKLYQAQALQIMSLNVIHQFSPSVLLSWCHLQGEKHSQVCSFLWCKPHLFAGSPASGIILEQGQL